MSNVDIGFKSPNSGKENKLIVGDQEYDKDQLNAGLGASGGVNQIVAGTNVTVDPIGGTGVVTVNSTATGAAITGTSVVYVSNSGNDLNSGISPDVPKENLQAAIDTLLAVPGNTGGTVRCMDGSTFNLLSTITVTAPNPSSTICIDLPNSGIFGTDIINITNSNLYLFTLNTCILSMFPLGVQEGCIYTDGTTGKMVVNTDRLDMGLDSVLMHAHPFHSEGMSIAINIGDATSTAAAPQPMFSATTPLTTKFSAFIGNMFPSGLRMVLDTYTEPQNVTYSAASTFGPYLSISADLPAARVPTPATGFVFFLDTADGIIKIKDRFGALFRIDVTAV